MDDGLHREHRQGERCESVKQGSLEKLERFLMFIALAGWLGMGYQSHKSSITSSLRLARLLLHQHL